MININLIQKIILVLKYPQTTIRFIRDKIFFHNKPLLYPDTIHLNITEKCNFNCPMCHVKNSRIKKMSELSFKDLKPLFDESKKYFPTIQFSGGEPLMHHEIDKMISYLHKNKIVTGLVTNGLLLEKYSESLYKNGLDFLAISLDGPDEFTQYQRGLVRGSFNKIIKGIIKIIKVRKNNLFPNVRIATVISHLNIHNFHKISYLAKKLKANQWSLSHHFYFNENVLKQQNIYSKKYKMGDDIWGEYIGSKTEFFDKKQRKIIRSNFNTLNKNKNFLNKHIRLTLPPTLDLKKYYKSFPPGKGSHCNSFNHQVFIRGNGDVEMCQGYILGNIKNESLYNIWNGPKAKHFRSIINKHKITPACFRCCSLNISFK